MKRLLKYGILFAWITMFYGQYAVDWTSSNLGQYGWGGAFGYDIDSDGLVEYYLKSTGQIIFYNGDYSIELSVSVPGYDYVNVIQPRDTDGDGLALPLNMDNDGTGEIVIVAYYYNASASNYYGKFRIYDAGTYALEFESPVITGFYGSASLEDINGDNRDELILVRYGSSMTASYVDIYTYTGSVAENHQSYKSLTSCAYPNPTPHRFTIPVTVYADDLKHPVKVQIFDNSGRRIKSIMKNKVNAPGIFYLQWDCTDDKNDPVPTGNYFVNIETGTGTYSRKISVIR